MLNETGQWDLNALEALERETAAGFIVLEKSSNHPIDVTPIKYNHQPNVHPHDHDIHQQEHQYHHNHHHPHHQQQQDHQHHNQHLLHGFLPQSTTILPNEDQIELELQDHIKHCSCTCNHMGYGNFMDYQTSCFGGLPDVTEHTTTHRHPMTLKESEANSFNNNNNNAAVILGGIDGISICSNINKKQSLSSLDLTSTPTQSMTEPHPNGKPQCTIRDKHDNNNNNKKPIKKYCLYVCITMFLLATIITIGLFLIHFLHNFYNATRNNDYDVQRMQIVMKLLYETPLIDGHNDLPWNIRRFSQNRLSKLNVSSLDLNEKFPWHNSPWSQTDIRRLKQGLIGAQFWSAYVPCESQGVDAVQLGLEQIDLIQRLSQMYEKHMVLVSSAQNIIETHRNGMIASMIGLEGGHAIGASLGVLRTMYRLGVRYLTLTHTCDNTLAGSIHSVHARRGLTAFGRLIVKEMNRIGMIIDLSYASEQTIRDVLRETRAPVIFSHTAARSLCNSTKNLNDEILRAIADNGGIIMISFHALLITCSRYATIKDVIRHINYIRSIAGVQHIGIGAGYDGMDAMPLGLEDVSKYPNVFSELLKNNTTWTENDISLLAGKNFLRVFKAVENVSEYLKNMAVPPQETMHAPEKRTCI